MIAFVRRFRREHRLLSFGIVLFLLYTFYHCVLVPLSFWTDSDYAFAGTMVPELLELLYTAVELCAFFYAYAGLNDASFFEQKRDAYRVGAVYAGLILYRYAVNLGVIWLIEGFSADKVGSDITYTLENIALEIMQAAVVFIICRLISSKKKRELEVQNAGRASLGQASVTMRDEVFPFRKLFGFSNPLQRSAALSAAVVSLSRIIGRVIYDVQYGAPTDAVDLLWMIAYYLSDLLVGLLGYLLLLFLLLRREKRDSRT